MNRRNLLVGLGIAFAVLVLGLFLAPLFEGARMPGLPEFRIYPLVVAAALIGLGYLAYVSASNNTAGWGWPRAVVVLAVIGIVGYVLWEYRTGAANESTASGGSTSVSGVNTDGLDNLGKFPLPPPGITPRGSTGATSWDPNKPPLKASGQAPTFASAVPDDGKPFAGDVSRGSWCRTCGSGISMDLYTSMKCNPDKCKK